MRGRAFEMGGRLPYQPVVEAIHKALEAENAPEDLLDDTWLVELSRLLPEDAGVYPDLDLPEKRDPAMKSRLFEAIARLTLAVADRQPILFSLMMRNRQALLPSMCFTTSPGVGPPQVHVRCYFSVCALSFAIHRRRVSLQT